jgi:hypothetical protein
MLTEKTFLQYEQLRDLFLDQIIAAGFTGQEQLDLQLATINFLHGVVTREAATPDPVMPPPVVNSPPPATDPNLVFN